MGDAELTALLQLADGGNELKVINHPVCLYDLAQLVKGRGDSDMLEKIADKDLHL